MKELVSIVVPVYRAAEYIADTIQMVRAQTHPAWELILVEDGSGDGSADAVRKALQGLPVQTAALRSPFAGVAEEFCCDTGQKILLLSKQHNEGAAKARNTGIREAQGRYLAFLDADDVWMPDKLEKELAFLTERQAGFVFTSYEFGDEAARPTGHVVHAPASLTYKEALSRTVIFTTTVLFDRNRIPQELLYMPDVASEDTATWWQILRAGYTAYGLDEVLAVYRRPPGSLSSNKWQAIQRIWKLYRRQEKLSVAASAYYFIFWAFRATARRIA